MNEDQQPIPISVWLFPSRLRLNFCMICRENLHFQVEGYPRTIIFGVDASKPQGDSYRPLKYPIKVRCSGKSQRYGRCPALWVIQGYIEDGTEPAQATT